MNRVLTIAMFVFSACSLKPGNVSAQSACGFEKMHEALMLKDPLYKQRVADDLIRWSKYAKLQSLQREIINGNDTIYEIPLVFHIMHTGNPVGDPYNPTDQQIADLVDYTNATYQAQVPGFPVPGNGGVRVPFRFVLAKRDPGCMPTSGVLRVDMSAYPDYIANGVGIGGMGDADMKALSIWPNDQYYNVWVVNYIDGPFGGTAGYAYYPGASSSVDGTVLLSSYAASGTSTLTHEIGHGMGLPHTFNGDVDGTVCPVNNDCTIDGDGICDTEPHMRGVGCSTTLNPCTGQSMNFTQHSYMSYSHGCRDRFTAGQRDKMLYNLRNNRYQLMHSLGAVPPPPMPGPAVCLPVSANVVSPYDAGPREVHFGTIHNLTGGFTSSANLGYADFFCTQQTELFLGDAYPIAIVTGNMPENVRVYIDYNDNGTFDLPDELVYSSNGSLANQHHTGMIVIPASGPVICQPLRMRVISDLAAFPAPEPCGLLQHGQAEDYVVTIKPAMGADLSFQPISDYPTCEDSLLVFEASTLAVPQDSVITWFLNGVAVYQGTTFSSDTLEDGDVLTAVTTVMNTVCGTPDSIRSQAFTVHHFPHATPKPHISLIGNLVVSDVTPVQWYLNDTLIPGATGQTYHPLTDGYYHAVLAATPCPSKPSNVLLVSLLTVGEYAMDEVRIYPNPAKNELTLQWEGRPANISLAIYNTLGQALFETKLTNVTKEVIPLNNWPNGIYFLRIVDEDGRAGMARIQVLH